MSKTGELTHLLLKRYDLSEFVVFYDFGNVYYILIDGVLHKLWEILAPLKDEEAYRNNVKEYLRGQ